MYYVNPYSFFEAPEKDWQKLLEKMEAAPPEPSLFDWGGLLFSKRSPQSLFIGFADLIIFALQLLADSNNKKNKQIQSLFSNGAH